MTYTRLIGIGAGKIIHVIVHGLALSRINPNVLTFVGLLINIWAAYLLAAGRFRAARLLIIFALFDKMAPVLWVIAILGNITVIHRMVFTWQEARRLEEAQLRAGSPSGGRPLNIRARKA